MDFEVYCALCQKHACHFFHTLDNSVWAVCDGHASLFWNIAVWLDPDVHDLESYFESYISDE